MAKKELTEPQKRVLKFIKGSLLASGYPPTLREIGQSLGIRSTNGVSEHLKALMRKGYLAKETGKSRTLTILEPKSKPPQVLKEKVGSIPILGSLKELESNPLGFELCAVLDKANSCMTIFRRDNKEYVAISSFHFAD